MQRTIHKLDEEHEFSVEVNAINDVQLDYHFSILKGNNDSDFWFHFFSNFIHKQTSYALETNSIIKFEAGITANYERRDGSGMDPITRSMKKVANLYRERSTRKRRISYELLYLFNPMEALGTAFNELNYNLVEANDVKDFFFTLYVPFEYNPKALPTEYRLQFNSEIFHKCIDYIHNSDPYCVAHTIFHVINNLEFKLTNVNNNEEYMDKFTAWFNENKLNRFYEKIDEQTNFKLHLIDKLEKQLGLNINVYIWNDETLKRDLHYRSDFAFDTEPVNLFLVRLGNFYHKKTKKAADQVKARNEVILFDNPDIDFFSNIQVKNFMNTSKEYHCCTITNLSYFSRNNKAKSKSICKYCHGTFNDDYVESHQVSCLNHYRSSSKYERVKTFKELKPYNKVKTFNKYNSLWKLPYAVFDFETRIVKLDDDREVHEIYSYAIYYNYIFNQERSKIIMKDVHSLGISSDNLLDSFLSDVGELGFYHRSLMTEPINYEKRSLAKQDIPSVCPICDKGPDEGEELEMDYNHDHFIENNGVNGHLEKFICHKCNISILTQWFTF